MYMGQFIVSVQNKGIVYEGDSKYYAEVVFNHFKSENEKYVNWSNRGVVVKDFLRKGI